MKHIYLILLKYPVEGKVRENMGKVETLKGIWGFSWEEKVRKEME